MSEPFWFYGKMVKWALSFHIKKEVRPASEGYGLKRYEVRQLFHQKMDEIFDEAWPSDLSDDLDEYYN